MLRRIRLGRHAGAIYFAVACILAASLLMFRLRRPPAIIIEASRGSSAALAEGSKTPAEHSASGGSATPSIIVADVRPSEIKDDAPAATGAVITDLEDDASQQGQIYVHVTGQVAKPGLYGLPEGSRVHQAVEAAGGMTSKADRDSVNIALPVGDGQQVFIPAIKQPAVTSTPLKSTASAAAETKHESNTEETAGKAQTTLVPEPQGRLDVTAEKPEQAGGGLGIGETILKIDINAAGQAELEQLPGIGPSTAVKIIEYRQANGPFASIEGLMDVSGIGPAKFAAMKDMVVVR